MRYIQTYHRYRFRLIIIHCTLYCTVYNVLCTVSGQNAEDKMPEDKMPEDKMPENMHGQNARGQNASGQNARK